MQGRYTSLHCAADKGHLDLAEFLIQNGAELEVLDEVPGTQRQRFVVDIVCSVGTHPFLWLVIGNV